MKNLKPQPELPTPALHQWYPILVQLPLTSTSIYQQTPETKKPPMVMKKNMKKKNNIPQQPPSHPTPQTPTTTQNILLCTNTCIVNSSILPLHGTTYKLCVARAILLERRDDVEKRRRRRNRGLRCIPLGKTTKRVSADEEDDEDDYRKRDYMYGCMYVPTLDMHTCTCLVPYMRFPVQKLLVLINYFLASYMGIMN